jgi:hypothetical protein
MFILGVSQGPGYPLYLLWQTPPQKATASIPHAKRSTGNILFDRNKTAESAKI